MKAIKVEMILEDNIDGEFFIMHILPKLIKEHRLPLKQAHYYKCEWFEK